MLWLSSDRLDGGRCSSLLADAFTHRKLKVDKNITYYILLLRGSDNTEMINFNYKLLHEFIIQTLHYKKASFYGLIAVFYLHVILATGFLVLDGKFLMRISVLYLNLPALSPHLIFLSGEN